MISELERSELIDVLEQATAKLLAGQDLVQPDVEWTALVTGILELIYADDEGRKNPEMKGRPVSEDLLMLEDDAPDAKLVINWPKVGARAGLDADEVHILELRSAGLTREVILSKLAQDDVERR